MVVSIVVDQLRADYMEKYMHLYGEDGFKKLLAGGRVYSNGYYSHAAPDRSSAVASIYSGTTPYYHGISGNRFLERRTLRVLSSVDDEAHAGTNTFESTSPSRLLVTTFADELKLATKTGRYGWWTVYVDFHTGAVPYLVGCCCVDTWSYYCINRSILCSGT